METITTKNNIKKGFKLNEDCDLTGNSNIAADSILVTKDGQAIALYLDSESVLYDSLEDLLEEHSVDLSYYYESDRLINFWNNSESIDASKN